MHLAAGIVDVVLALHVESDRFEDVGDACAVRGSTAVPHMERSGGIRGDELHLDTATISERRTRALHTGADDAAHRLRECRRRNAEVDETWPGDLDRCDRGRLGQPRHDALGDLARLAPGDAREGEGDGAREVAVAIPAAALDRNVGQRIEREVPVVAKCRQRVLEERSDVLLH